MVFDAAVSQRLRREMFEVSPYILLGANLEGNGRGD